MKKLKESVQQLQQERNKILSIQSEIKRLEETEEVKNYLELLDLYEEKTAGRNTEIETYTDEYTANGHFDYIDCLDYATSYYGTSLNISSFMR